MSNPPFAERNWGYDDLVHDPDWEYAAPAAIVAVTHARVERVVLVAPPVDTVPFNFAPLASSGVPVSILVGTDGSETAHTALRRAVELAAGLRARLTIVSAYEPVSALHVASNTGPAADAITVTICTVA